MSIPDARQEGYCSYLTVLARFAAFRSSPEVGTCVTTAVCHSMRQECIHSDVLGVAKSLRKMGVVRSRRHFARIVASYSAIEAPCPELGDFSKPASIQAQFVWMYIRAFGLAFSFCNLSRGRQAKRRNIF